MGKQYIVNDDGRVELIDEELAEILSNMAGEPPEKQATFVLNTDDFNVLTPKRVTNDDSKLYFLYYMVDADTLEEIDDATVDLECSACLRKFVGGDYVIGIATGKDLVSYTSTADEIMNQRIPICTDCLWKATIFLNKVMDNQQAIL